MIGCLLWFVGMKHININVNGISSILKEHADEIEKERQIINAEIRNE